MKGGVVYDMMLEAERDDYEDDTGLYRKSYDGRGTGRRSGWREWYRSDGSDMLSDA